MQHSPQTRPFTHRRTSSTISNLDSVIEDLRMSQPVNIPKTRSQPNMANGGDSLSDSLLGDKTYASSALLGESPPSLMNGGLSSTLSSSPPTPSGNLSRTASFSNSSAYDDDPFVPPMDRISVFDLLENLALPQRLEQLQANVTQSMKKQRQRLTTRSQSAREKVVEEWRRRVPTSEEKMDRYRKRMRDRVDRVGKIWNDRKTVTVREKISFIAAVMNIFISGYLVGAKPEWFPVWYGAQLAYFMPIRWWTYHRRGYHYFLADLCYFVNVLLCLSIWVFPRSKRLLLSTFCLAYGNNAVAIAMWRNMLVFHSLDKVTSLFIHIMPCVTLHCIIHLLSADQQKERYPAVYAIKHSAKSDPFHYSLPQMILWSSIPYALWQANYYFFITVRRAEKIAAGRPTSFKWLRRSYEKTWIGKFVLSLPPAFQEFAFMAIQYGYAMSTTLPCPIWFWYRYMSAGFLTVVFAWSIYNGATYYIDIFGRRFEKELEQLRKDVLRWQSSGPDGMKTPLLSPDIVGDGGYNSDEDAGYWTKSAATMAKPGGGKKQRESIDAIPLLQDEGAKDIAVNGGMDEHEKTPTTAAAGPPEDKKTA